ncbi:hypothetical protein [Rhodoblastus sp.]|uniref:hypothetical protein n=1 Tax=Rhodoblastus sp. TaxID=1962975 RepID=UPI0025ED8B3E|nr:hypothetical protein [Rhodoblastus sp.]
MSRKLLILAAALSLPAASANAFHSGKAPAVDSGVRHERASYCANNHYRCLQKEGPWSRRYPSQWNQCEISYDQCMRH